MPVGSHVTNSWGIYIKIYCLLPKTLSKKLCPTEFERIDKRFDLQSLITTVDTELDYLASKVNYLDH